MNILQILPSLKIGGVETGTVDLAGYLVEQGHSAVVISGGGPLVEELKRRKASHYTLPVDKKSLFNSVRMIRRVSEIIRKEEIDIVHARSRVPAWIAFFACKITKRPFVTTAHGHYKRHFLSQVMSWGRVVIVASHAMAKHMINSFGVPLDVIRLIPRGVDLSRFSYIDQSERVSVDFTVGMVSRITPLKGHACFLKAVSIAYRAVPKLKVLVVGEAPKGKDRYRQELQLLMKRLGLTRVVEFTGAKKDISNLLGRFDVLVSSTITPEAFGRSIIEAQARGIPVIATKVGGVVDIIEDRKNGLLVNPEDPKSMAEAIIELYKDAELRRALAQNARKKVEEEYTLAQMADRTLAVYREVLATKNILIIKMSSIGDCILSIPSLRAVRAAYRDARIKLLVGVVSRDVFNNCPYIDERIVCDFRGRDRGVKGFFRTAAMLARENFDIIIDLQNNKRSHALAFFSFAPERCGYRNKKLGFLLNKAIVDSNVPCDPLEHQFRVLRAAGIEARDKRLELFPSPEDEQWAQHFIESQWVNPSQRLVGINLRASPRWISKNWPIEYIAHLCNKAASAFNMRMVITGSKEDTPLLETLTMLTDSKPIIAVGKTTLLRLAALMKYFKVYISPDSAPLHIAMSSGVPVVGLFGPTDPARHMVPSSRSVILRKDLECSFCYDPRCGRGEECMRGISADDVFDAVKELLGVRERPITADQRQI